MLLVGHPMRQGEDPDKKKYPGPPGWDLGVRLKTQLRKNFLRCLKKKRGDQGPTRSVNRLLLLLLLLFVIECNILRSIHFAISVDVFLTFLCRWQL